MEIHVVAHRPLPVDLPSPFRVLHVGAAAAEGLRPNDRDGDSIADLNPMYSELTGQYWIWKNHFPTLPADRIVGFAHYRRYLTFEHDFVDIDRVMRLDHEARLREIFARGHDVVLPKPTRYYMKRGFLRHSRRLGRLVFPWTPLPIGERYAMVHHREDLTAAIDHLPSPHRDGFVAHLAGNAFTAYNMYVARKSLLDDYFSTLFPWFRGLERVIDVTGRSVQQTRVFGFLGERFASYWFGRLPRPYRSTVSRVFR